MLIVANADAAFEIKKVWFAEWPHFDFYFFKLTKSIGL